jgi:hypothetical protein
MAVWLNWTILSHLPYSKKDCNLLMDKCVKTDYCSSSSLLNMDSGGITNNISWREAVKGSIGQRCLMRGEETHKQTDGRGTVQCIDPEFLNISCKTLTGGSVPGCFHLDVCAGQISSSRSRTRIQIISYRTLPAPAGFLSLPPTTARTGHKPNRSPAMLFLGICDAAHLPAIGNIKWAKIT